METQIPCTQLKVGDVVMTGNGPREVTEIRRVNLYGNDYLRWSWMPGVPAEGRVDCGYSGHRVESADEHMVTLVGAAHDHQ